jgi:hypothetical protein
MGQYSNQLPAFAAVSRGQDNLPWSWVLVELLFGMFMAPPKPPFGQLRMR